MATTKFSWILPAVQIWAVVATAFAILVLVGREQARWNYCWLFTISCWFALDVHWAFAARRAKPAVEGRQSLLTLLCTFLIYAVYCLPLSFLPILVQRVVPHFAALEMFGAFLCASGIGIAIWARHTLGKSWQADVTLKTDHVLVRHGPYAIVRHPIYLGLLVAVVGMGLVLGEVR